MTTRTRVEIYVFIFGLTVFAVGLSLAWLPLGFIGTGLVLMLVSALGPRDESEPKT